jgi:hypothetical protein
MGKKLRYVSSDRDPLYLHSLRNRFLRTPNVEVEAIDPDKPADFESFRDSVQTALCVNVLEYAANPGQVLQSLRSTVQSGGNIIVLVPQGAGLFGKLDQTLGHKRRFAESELRGLLEAAGFTVEKTHQVNKISKPAWWLHSKVLGTARLNKVTLKIFDKTVWFWRRVDWLLPWKGLSLVVVARAKD